MLKLTIFLLLNISLASAGEFFIKFNPEISIEEFKVFIQEDTFESIWGLDLEDEDFFKSSILIKTDKRLREIERDELVQKVQSNFVYKVQFPDDPKIIGHWGLDNDSIKKVWSEVTGCIGIPVAILDTGVNFNHEDLEDTFWQRSECKLGNGVFKDNCQYGLNLFDKTKLPDDFNGHGTYMASLIGAVGNNSLGISGLCQKSQIMEIKVLDNFGEGSTLQIVRGIRFAIENGAKILNLSFGRFGRVDFLLKEELIRASNSGALIVTPAGNSSIDLNEKKFWPCSFDIKGLLCVASLNKESELSSFSNYGNELIDLAAPGVDLLGAGIGQITYDGPELDMFGPNWKLLEKDENCLDTPSPTLVYPANFCELGNEEIVLPKVEWQSRNYSLLEFKSGNEINTKIDLTDCGEYCLLSIGEKGPLAIWDIKIKTIMPSNKHYQTLSGTSISAGYVAGVAALLWSYNTNFSLMDIKEAIINGGRKFEHLVDSVKGCVALWPSDNLVHLKKPKGIKAFID